MLALIFIVVMIWVVRPAVPRWLRADRLAREEPTSGTLATVVCVAIAAALCTEVIGIHALFGAFLAGAIMPDAEGFRERINTYVERFSSVLLLPLFFAFTGLRTQVGLLDDLRGLGALPASIIVVATAGKLGAAAVAARLAGMALARVARARHADEHPRADRADRAQHRLRHRHPLAAHLHHAGDHGAGDDATDRTAPSCGLARAPGGCRRDPARRDRDFLLERALAMPFPTSRCASWLASRPAGRATSWRAPSARSSPTRWKQQVVVENRPGAGGNTLAAEVVRERARRPHLAARQQQHPRHQPEPVPRACPTTR